MLVNGLFHAQRVQDVRGQVVHAYVTHVDGNIMLIRKRVRDGLNKAVLRDDALSHDIERSLILHQHVLPTPPKVTTDLNASTVIRSKDFERDVSG